MGYLKGLAPIIIGIIIAGVLTASTGSYVGVRYYRSNKFSKAADKYFEIGNYEQAIDLYNKSLSKWKNEETKKRINTATKELELLSLIKSAQLSLSQSNWQECIDKLSNFDTNSKSYANAQNLTNECAGWLKKKADEEAKQKAEAEAAAKILAEKETNKATENNQKQTVTSTTSQTPAPSTTPATPPPAEDPAICKSNASPVFTHNLIDLSSVTNIKPPPNIAIPSGHLKTHSYIDTTSPGIPLYAPVDMVLFKGDYYTGGPYTLDFRISCEVTLRVAHVTEPVENIRQAFGTDPDAAAEIQISPPITFKAGELFAYSGGPPYVLNNGLDFGVYNSTKPNRYTESQTSSIYTTAVCPYDYFSSDLQAAYREKFNLVQHTGMTPDGDSFCQ